MNEEDQVRNNVFVDKIQYVIDTETNKIISIHIPNTPIYQGLKHVDDMSGCEVEQLEPCLDDLMDER